MVEIAAVGWEVSPVIKLIIDKTQSYISNKLFHHAGLEHDMRKMEITLSEILAIMVIVEKQRIEDQHQVKLVWQIKDAVYDAEDVIDEFDYNILDAKSEQQKSKVSRLISNKYGKLKFKHKVKEVNGKLDLAKGSAKDLLELMNVNNSLNIQSHQQENQRVIGSSITEKIIGRDKECDLLINLLKEQVEGSPAIIQITGQGGVGKTALAQMAYNDPRVLDHFDQKMWLTVSDNFYKLWLTKEMIKYVGQKFSTDYAGFAKLREKLKTELASKKVLLVLDDVWCDMDHKGRHVNEKQWLEFLAPLNTAKAGSKIILTSRQGLWKSTSLSIRLFPLDRLNDDDSWSLLKMCAFDSDNQHKRQELEPIGKEIVNKLKGLSLAIRVVGTQLRGNSDVKEWRTLNDKPLDTSDVMNILRLSYEHLPQHLKHCFAYCSIFPKYYRFKPDRLVHMWITQGFVFAGERNDLEDVGKLCFKGLLARSFFQVIKQGSKEYYVMHDIMHDLACHVSKGECYRLEKGDPMTNLGSIRHLSVTFEAMDILMNIPGLDKLRTLMFLGSCQVNTKDINDKFKMLKKIRALDLQDGISDLETIRKYKHLRYLSFRNTLFDERLPDWFRKLHQLKVLFVRKGYYLGRKIVFPKFSYSLQFIYFSKSYFLDVGKHVQQIVPTRFRGGSVHLHLNNNKYGLHGIDVLGDMNNIEGSLHIIGLEHVTSREEAIQALLHNKQSLTTLVLEFWRYNSHPWETESRVLEALVPNHNLQHLRLRGFKGAAWPSWLETNLLSSVKSIHLFGCIKVEMLPSLGQLPLLKELDINNLISVRRIGLEFYGKGIFPSLEDLCIYNLEILEEWCYPCDTPVFPKLNKLQICGAKLECFSLPQIANPCDTPVFPKLTRLEISRCEKLITLEGLDELVSLQSLYIQDCEKLITLEGLDELVSLRGLYIENCPNLLFLLEMEHFYSLEFLAIFDCPKLSALPKKGLPVSLRVLCIGGIMHPSLKDQIRNKKGPEWNKVAAISECHLCVAFGILGAELRRESLLLRYRDSVCYPEDFAVDGLICRARKLTAYYCYPEDYYDYAECIRKYGVNKDAGAQ